MSVGQAVGRVARAPVLIATIALAQWLLAKLVALPVVAGVEAATEGYAPGIRPAAVERIVAVVAELFIAEPSVASTMVTVVFASAVISFVVWSLLSAGVLARLAPTPDGSAPSLATVGAAALGRLPGVLAQSGWHMLLRAAAILAMFTATGALPGPIPALVIGITTALAIVALDLARAGVVVGDASPYHPRTAWRALITVVRTPALSLPAGAMAALGLACAGSTSLMALWALSDPTWLWGARALSVVTLVLGLVRIAFVAGHPAALALAAASPMVATSDPAPDEAAGAGAGD